MVNRFDSAIDLRQGNEQDEIKIIDKKDINDKIKNNNKSDNKGNVDKSKKTNKDDIEFDILSMEFKSFLQMKDAYIDILKKLIEFENRVGFGNTAKKKKRTRFQDKYVPAMISIRPKILEYIELIEENSVYTKAEIIDKILISGINNVNFE